MPVHDGHRSYEEADSLTRVGSTMVLVGPESSSGIVRRGIMCVVFYLPWVIEVTRKLTA